MSFDPSGDAKEQIRQSVDVVDLIGSYLTLQRKGRDYVGLCPFHNDSRPSLHVNPQRQIWRCFVCQDGGDVFSFVMRREGVDFRQALEMLAERAGIELRPQHKPARPGGTDDKAALYRALAWAEGLYHEHLIRSPAAEAARTYLEDRGITRDSALRFRLGYAPSEWQWLVDRAAGASHSPAVLEAAGLTLKSERTGRPYDRFRGRVLFPIRDTQDRPIAFGGRILPGDPDANAAKYINSPESRIFSKSEHLYGLNLAREGVKTAKKIVVMEGYTDVVMAHQHGIDYAVAVLGTGLGSRHIQVLKRFVDQVVLLLDGDEPGQRRAEEIVDLFIAGQVDLRVATLPDNLDPCDFLRRHDPAEMRRLIDEAIDALEHKIRRQLHGVDPLVDSHRASRAAESILQTMAKAPGLGAGAGAAARLRESQALARLSRELALPEPDLRSRLQEMRKASSKAPLKAAAEAETVTKPPLPTTMTQAERELLEVLALHEELAAAALDELSASELPSPAAREIWQIYQSLDEAGRPVSFERVLTEVEDPRLKSLLVSLEQSAEAKEPLASQDAPTRLRLAVERLKGRHEDQRLRARQASLERDQLGADEELQILRELLDRKQRGQPESF